jgi:hypothetical protein
LVSAIAFCHAIRSRNVFTCIVFSPFSLFPFVASSLRRYICFLYLCQFFQHLKALLYRREHAECEAVDLEDAECVDVVLVPFDEGSIGHGAVFDGDHLTQWPAGDDKAADMLGQMTRKADELPDEFSQHTNRAIGRVEAGLVHEVFGQDIFVPPLVPFRECGDVVERQAECLADVANRRSGSIGNDLRDNAGMLSPVFVINVLEDLLAAFVLEVDVNVGRFVALGADETLEEQFRPIGIDAGDSEDVADGGVGGTAAPLA